MVNYYLLLVRREDHRLKEVLVGVQLVEAVQEVGHQAEVLAAGHQVEAVVVEVEKEVKEE